VPIETSTFSMGNPSCPTTVPATVVVIFFALSNGTSIKGLFLIEISFLIHPLIFFS
jgi:hypothetical protein